MRLLFDDGSVPADQAWNRLSLALSRGNDPEIYQERKNMGQLLCDQVLKAVDYDLKDTIFSYIPNTAETAWIGLMKGIEDHLRDYRRQAILDFFTAWRSPEP